jgi:hypothetical protein
MAQPTFSQSESRSYFGPLLVATCLLIAACTGAWLYIPHRTADVFVTHTTLVPIHSVTETGSKLVGQTTRVEDDLYVLLTIRIENKLHDPLFLSDFTAIVTTPNGETSTSAIEHNDLEAVYTAYPQVKSAATTPLLRESTIARGSSGEGMVMLHFPFAQTIWDGRQTATLTVTFYHQPPITITIPKA